MSVRPEYILQASGSCCSVITLLNALRYFGRETTAPGEAGWDDLVDLAGCQDGSAINVDSVAEHLGLVRHLARVSPDITQAVPFDLTVWNPESTGTSLHSVLVIGGSWPALEMVNYRWESGPVVETAVPEIPGRISRRGSRRRRPPEAWHIRLRGAEGA